MSAPEEETATEPETWLIRCAECGYLLGADAEAERKCPRCGSLERERTPVGDSLNGPAPEPPEQDAEGFAVTAPTFPLEIVLSAPGLWKQHYPDGRVDLKAVGMQQTQMGAQPTLPAVVWRFDAVGWQSFVEFVQKSTEQIQQEAEAAAARARIQQAMKQPPPRLADGRPLPR